MLKHNNSSRENNYRKAYSNNLQVWINVGMEFFSFSMKSKTRRKKLEKAPQVTFPDDLIKFCCFFLSLSLLPSCTRTKASNIIRKPYKTSPHANEALSRKTSVTAKWQEIFKYNSRKFFSAKSQKDERIRPTTTDNENLMGPSTYFGVGIPDTICLNYLLITSTRNKKKS